MKKAFRVFISGSVQGILFRDFIKDNADRLGVRGFVRNLEDGRVEVFIEGDHEAIENMIEACKQGPKYAHIKNVEVKDERFQGLKDFRVIRF